MKKKCFSCQHGANSTLLSSLELHKKIYDTTGKVFWFFKESKEGQTKIASDESFKIIKEQIKDNAGAEWSHIAEFGQPSNDNLSKNTANKKSKAVASESKSKRTRKPLENNL
jgi:hypothetical protein